jgi:hypothetical protein
MKAKVSSTRRAPWASSFSLTNENSRSTTDYALNDDSLIPTRHLRPPFQPTWPGRRRVWREFQRKRLVISLLLLFAICHALPAFSVTASAFVPEEEVLVDPLRILSSLISSTGIDQFPHVAVLGRLPWFSAIVSGRAAKYESTRWFIALFLSEAAKTGLPAETLLSDCARLPRRESRRAAATLVVRLGVRESGELNEELLECGCPPSIINSPPSRGQPAQNGQKSHLISHPSRASLLGQFWRDAPGTHGRTRWYHLWWHRLSETLSSATHMID